MISPCNKILNTLFLVLVLFPTMVLYAQCPQNNLTVENIYFYDEDGNPFFEDAAYSPGTLVNGQIFVKFGGSANNSYSLYFSYDLIINDQVIERVELCLFQGTTVKKDKPQFITDFSLTWGDKVEFGNVFMRWFTNNSPTCPGADGSNAQCFTNQGRFLVNTPFIPLPVIWKEIKVKPDPFTKNNLITWSTAKEWESSHFEIERSTAGIEAFESIGEVKSAGWSDQVTEYQFTDDKIPLGAHRLYYRIKQVDLDGSTDYSKTLLAENKTETTTSNSWQVFPNPMQDASLRLNYRGTKLPENVEIRIYALSNSKKLRLQATERNMEIGHLLQEFPKGVLIMEIIAAESVENIRIIKN